MKEAILVLLLLSVTAGEVAKEKFLHDNQIIFRESGVIVNKAVFVHVKFTMQMGPTLDAVKEVEKKLKKVNEGELRNAQMDLLPYLMGSEKGDSIWRQNETSELWRKRAMDGVAITGMLHNMFNKTAAQLEDALGIIPEKHDINQGHRFHERSKRFVGIVMASVNTHRIHNIEQSLKNFSGKYNMLVDNVQDLSGKHIQLAVDLLLLKDLVRLLSHKNYHKIITLMITLEDQLKDTVLDVKAIAREGNRGRIAPEMLGGDELIRFYKKLEEKAGERGCKMVMEAPSDVYEMEATYGYDPVNRTFNVFLHVPMYEMGEELKLWEYVPFPILQSIKLNATVLPQTGKENYIALMPDASIRTDTVTPPHKFRIFNEYDLDICKRIRNVYLCSGRNTVRTDIANSCVGNLYLRDHEGISRTCDLEIGKLGEYVAKLGPNRWMVFSPKPFLVTMFCGKKSETLRFDIQTLIELPEDCKVNLQSTQLTTDVNINIEYNIQRFDWKYDGNIFQELEIDDKELAQMMQEMIATKSKFGLKDLSHLKHYFEFTENGLMKMFNYVKDMFSFLFILDDIIVAVVVIVIVIVLIMVLSRMGCLVRICGVIKGSNQLINVPAIGAQIGHAILERERSDSAERRSLVNPERGNLVSLNMEQIAPPSYGELVASCPPREVRREGTIRRTDSVLSMDSRFDAGSYRERQIGIDILERGPCNPGPIAERGLRIEDFVCTQHLANGRSGTCAGYFLRGRNVRFQIGEEESI